MIYDLYYVTFVCMFKIISHLSAVWVFTIVLYFMSISLVIIQLKLACMISKIVYYFILIIISRR